MIEASDLMTTESVLSNSSSKGLTSLVWDDEVIGLLFCVPTSVLLGGVKPEFAAHEKSAVVGFAAVTLSLLINSIRCLLNSASGVTFGENQSIRI